MIYAVKGHCDESNQKMTRHVFNRAGKFKFQSFKFPKLLFVSNIDLFI
jgi:hypothetical protein